MRKLRLHVPHLAGGRVLFGGAAHLLDDMGNSLDDVSYETAEAARAIPGYAVMEYEGDFQDFLQTAPPPAAAPIGWGAEPPAVDVTMLTKASSAGDFGSEPALHPSNEAIAGVMSPFPRTNAHFTPSRSGK